MKGETKVGVPIFKTVNVKLKIKDFVQTFIYNRWLFSGTIIFTIIVIMSALGSLLFPPDYIRVGRFPLERPPGGENILGTDSMGRDVFVSLLIATQKSLLVGLIVAIIGTSLGAAIGFSSGYIGGLFDKITSVIIDFFISVPSLLFLILISALTKVMDIRQVALIIAIFSWAGAARGVRAQTLSLKERDFINVSIISGMNTLEIIIFDIMPYMAQWLSAHFINSFLGGILAESGLAILGLSAMNEMTLGMMLYWCMSYHALMKGVWWWWGSIVVMLILVFLSLYLMHTGLDKIVRKI